MKTALLAVVLTTASLVSLAAPTPKETKKLPPPTEIELKASQKNLKQIALAIIGHSDTATPNGMMPRDTTDKDGKPLLSWRVAILPELGEADLYEQFKLDEPWDSKTNMAPIEKMPKVFAPTRVKAEKGETFYRGFTGADTAFEAGKQLTFPASFTDGLSNTILVVEAGEPCIWMKPGDWPMPRTNPCRSWAASSTATSTPSWPTRVSTPVPG